MTATSPLILTPDLRGAVLAARAVARSGAEFAARGDGVLARHGEVVEVRPVRGRTSLVALVEAQGPEDVREAALDAVVSRVRAEAASAVHLGALLAASDRAVREHPRAFVRALLVSVDPERHAVRIASAGAAPVLVVGRSGDVVVFDERGPALGLVPDAPWRETGPVRLAPGHLLVACSTGVAGAAREDDGRTFGEEALAGVVARCRALSARSAVRSVLREAAAFGGDDPAEGRTAFALRVR